MVSMRPRRPERRVVLAALPAVVLVTYAGKAFPQSELPPIEVIGGEAPHRKKPSPSRRTMRPAAAPRPVVMQPPPAAVGVASGPTGAPSMASELTISGEELNARAFARPGEALEAVPGLIATQHSGEGKANQYFLRGYNLDHGTDLAITVDGVPVNMRTHAHGQGYADLNWLIPETIGAMDVRKGPYFADEGDFASVGSIHIGLIDRTERGLAQLTVGSFGYRRLLGNGVMDYVLHPVEPLTFRLTVAGAF
ncbi:hypothetical protein ACVW16_002247 [Bradyrhizobium sp. USDA 4474]